MTFNNLQVLKNQKVKVKNVNWRTDLQAKELEE